MDIKDLNFRKRTYTKLKENNINNIEQLLKYDKYQLLSLPGIGDNICNEIQEVLRSYDFLASNSHMKQENLYILNQSIYYIKRNNIIEIKDNVFKTLISSSINTLNELFTGNDYHKLCTLSRNVEEYNLIDEMKELFNKFGFEFNYYTRSLDIKEKKLKIEDATILNLNIPCWLKRDLCNVNIFKLTDLKKYSEEELKEKLKKIHHGYQYFIEEIKYLNLELREENLGENIEELTKNKEYLLKQNKILLQEIKKILESQKLIDELNQMVENNNSLISEYDSKIKKIKG